MEDRGSAVLELASGKARVDQLAQRFGVRPSTVEKWRHDALEGMSQALRQGDGQEPARAGGSRRDSSRWSGRARTWPSRRSYWSASLLSALRCPGSGPSEPRHHLRAGNGEAGVRGVRDQPPGVLPVTVWARTGEEQCSGGTGGEGSRVCEFSPGLGSEEDPRLPALARGGGFSETGVGGDEKAEVGPARSRTPGGGGHRPDDGVDQVRRLGRGLATFAVEEPL